MISLKFFIGIFSLATLVPGNYINARYDPPCFFNPLCTCSKAYPDLGRVNCKNIPLLNIPLQINRSKVFSLHLENNGLRDIEPYFFSRTGLFRIEISWNFLTEISEETFTGLERSLWELKLKHNQFKRVPNRSIRYLQKLKMLDLSDNEITNIQLEDWLGLEDSLKILILGGNKLSSLRPRVFSLLQELEYLDLSGNALYEFDVLAFKDGPTNLNDLNLSDNLFSSIPFQQLSELRNLSNLDLSFNQITEIQDLNLERNKKKPTTLVLDTIRLDYNKIQYLPAESFKSFPTLKRIYLNGNPTEYIEKDAFKNSKISELHLQNCKLSDLKVGSFFGLEKYLELLDLENNNITDFSENFFKDFVFLKALKLKNNYFKEIDIENLFDIYQPSLQHIDLSGQQNLHFNLQNLKKFHNLRSLSVSKLIQTSLSPSDFPETLIALEEIKISKSNLKNLKSHVFKNVRGLRRLDLSGNSISTIENEVFSEIGHSLEYLSLANGLSFNFYEFPSNVFKGLSAIELLDISNNRLKVLPQKLFYPMKRLKIIQLQDNFIELIPKSSFQDVIHTELHTIQFSFNQISVIDSYTFKNLDNLENLWLNDNRIKKIEKRAFTGLVKLKYLYLRGNKITTLKEESFQDLPDLQKLDLAYNSLKTFNYNCIERVGTLSSFTLNISHNFIEQLTFNSSSPDYPGILPTHVNMKVLDVSHNNISFIGSRFFRPIEYSITHIYLSHNKLQNITRDAFGNMKHLQWFDISNNLIRHLENDCFVNSTSIQVLYLSDNRLQEIPTQLFKGFHDLRILDLASNDLRSIPDNLFNDGIIERLDVSGNQLTRFPIDSFDVDSAATLLELDLSQNAIMTLPSPDILAKFKNLYSLDVSKNRLMQIEDGTFSYLNRLRVLDISHNTEITISPKTQLFNGLDDSLKTLILKNVSLTTAPSLELRSLIELDLSDNNITSVPFEFSQNLTQVQRIELANNKITAIPSAINALGKLRYLGISGNPIESVKFQQSFSLIELDLRNISLNTLEKRALGKMPLLENIKISISNNTQELNLPYVLKDNHGLKHLFIEVLVSDGLSLEDELNGLYPAKLRNLTLIGPTLKTLPRNLLQGIQSPWLNLAIHNTSVVEFSGEIFRNVNHIKNISINVKSNKLRKMADISKLPNTSIKIFLEDLQIADNDWMCDCSLGWVEDWERKKRQYLCEDNDLDDLEECFLGSDDLRSATCSNRKPNTVLEILKTELECGWNSAKNLNPLPVVEVLIITFWFINFTL